MPESTTCTFGNDRGDELHARLTKPDGEMVAMAVFAHCFTCSKDLRVEQRIVRALCAEGIGVFSFDFTGLGRSKGDFADSTFSSDVDDLLHAADYLRDSEMAPTILVGHSLGGAAVLSAAGRIPEVDAVVTIAAPADPEHVEGLFTASLEEIREQGSAEVEIAGRTFTIRQSFLEDLRSHRLVDQVKRLKDVALLLFHSPQDETVEVSNARVLYDAARHPKSFVSLYGADHLLGNERDAAYVATVTAAWAARYVSPVRANEQRDGTADPSKAPPAGAISKAEAAGRYADASLTAVNSGGFRTVTSVRGFDLVGDEPSDVGGTEMGPTPYDFLGTALATCTAMTMRMYANRKAIPLESVEVDVAYDRTHAKDCVECEHTEGQIHLLRRTLRILGDDITEEQRAGLVRIADRCPVHRTLEGQVEIPTTVEA